MGPRPSALRRIIAAGETGVIAEVLPALVAGSARLRPRIVGLGNSAVARALSVPDGDGASPDLLALRQRWLADERGTDANAAEALVRLRQWQEMVDSLPQVIDRCAEALIHLGRTDEAYARFVHRPFQAGYALMAMGRYEDILAQPPPPPWLLGRVQFYWWREPALAPRGDSPPPCASCLAKRKPGWPQRRAMTASVTWWIWVAKTKWRSLSAALKLHVLLFCGRNGQPK